ncbi:MAG: metal-dependent transcriptional regulator [Bacilli bacterium]|jgi:DtxR family Mn-dependent transcriptional regulator
MPRQQSKEDYLEQIYVLKQKQDVVRSIDIANTMGYSKPSVSIAMKKLREQGYITFDENNYISLTNIGLVIAQKTYEKHTTIAKTLMLLGVPEEVARIDACKIEHDLSDISFAAIKEHLRKHQSSKEQK